MSTAQSTAKSAYQLRLHNSEDKLYELFYTLYGDRPGFHKGYRQLFVVLDKFYQQRSKQLKEKDRNRNQNPAWLLSEKWVGMALYVDRFNKDLRGLSEKIEYFKELGVNLIHLMPIMQSPDGENDGGYAVSNYLKVDAKFGTNEDLSNFVDLLSQNDMGLVLDLVINHTSNEHEWAKRALAGDADYQDYYLMYDKPNIPNQFEKALPEIFPETSPGNFVYNSNLKKYIFSTFNQYQWDLNYKNPAVFISMLENLLALLNMGADIVRLDAPAFIWKTLGTNCQNLPEVHIILQLFKLCTRIVAPGTALLSEAIVAPKEILKYFGGQEHECDLAYNALFMALMWDTICTQNNKLLFASLQHLPPKPIGTTWLNYVRCHDDIGLGYDDEHITKAGFTPFDHRQFLLKYLTGNYPGSFAKGGLYMYNPKTKDARISGSLASLAGLEKAKLAEDSHQIEIAIRRIILLHSMIFSFGGIPMLYYGDELGSVNDYSFEKDSNRAHDNRWMHRPLIEWKKAIDYQVPGTISHQIFTSLQSLIAIRKGTAEFADLNSTEIIDLFDPNLFAYLRHNDRSRTLVICNLSNNRKRLLKRNFDFLKPYFPNGFFDKIKGTEGFNPNGILWLGGYEFVWLGKK